MLEADMVRLSSVQCEQKGSSYCVQWFVQEVWKQLYLGFF